LCGEGGGEPEKKLEDRTETNIIINHPDLLTGVDQATRGCVGRGRGEPEKKLQARTETNIPDLL
jgi:hypothetical protein